MEYSEMKSYEYLLANDLREVDVWNRPIGPSYDDKRWEQLNKQEMMADFDWKNDLLLGAGGEPLDTVNFYDAIFSGLELNELTFDVVKKDADGNIIDIKKKPYKLLLNQYNLEKKKVCKIDVHELEHYLERDDVAVSPCLFYQNWRRKKLLNYVGAFALDIDKLRPHDLKTFLRLFDEGRVLRPSIIVNSGSGMHFYYVLNEMLRCDLGSYEANYRIVEAVYNKLYDVIIKDEWFKDAQRHWVGQDYRVVGSKTRLGQICSAFRVGKDYTIEELMQYLHVNIDPTTHCATYPQMMYAKSIAKDLELDVPNFENAKETYNFIAKNKDAAYLVREERRRKNVERKKKRKEKREKQASWYKKTYDYVLKYAIAGNRFNSLKALAIIAYKEGITLERLENDLEELRIAWSQMDWRGDPFNEKNIDAIIRLFNHCELYRNTRADTLEEWLRIAFSKIGTKRNGQTQKEHLEEARAIRDIRIKRKGKTNWWEGNGRPVGSGTAEHQVLEWQQKHPNGKKIECHRETGLDPKTIRKWWKENNSELK